MTRYDDPEPKLRRTAAGLRRALLLGGALLIVLTTASPSQPAILEFCARHSSYSLARRALIRLRALRAQESLSRLCLALEAAPLQKECFEALDEDHSIALARLCLGGRREPRPLALELCMERFFETVANRGSLCARRLAQSKSALSDKESEGHDRTGWKLLILESRVRLFELCVARPGSSRTAWLAAGILSSSAENEKKPLRDLLPLFQSQMAPEMALLLTLDLGETSESSSQRLILKAIKNHLRLAGTLEALVLGRIAELAPKGEAWTSTLLSLLHSVRDGPLGLDVALCLSALGAGDDESWSLISRLLESPSDELCRALIERRPQAEDSEAIEAVDRRLCSVARRGDSARVYESFMRLARRLVAENEAEACVLGDVGPKVSTRRLLQAIVGAMTQLPRTLEASDWIWLWPHARSDEALRLELIALSRNLSVSEERIRWALEQRLSELATDDGPRDHERTALQAALPKR